MAFFDAPSPEEEAFEEKYRWARRDRIVRRVIALIFGILLFAVIGFIFFRIWLSSYYPAEASGVLMSDGVAAYCRGAGKDAKAFEQEIRAPYDNTREGYFFAGETVILPENDTLQVSVRYNESTLEAFTALYGDAFDATAECPFEYRAVCSLGEDPAAADGIRSVTFSPAASRKASFLFYEYERLSFEGVPLSEVYWVRIDIYRRGQTDREAYIIVYENPEEIPYAEPLSAIGIPKEREE